MRMTFGLELELGDVLRSREIPTSLGKWEHSERDIVNLGSSEISRPYKNIACDPLGVAPPVGGEVNIYPAESPEKLADTIRQLLNWFRSQGDVPTACCSAHTHVHVRVPGMRDDVELLKKLTKYIQKNQQACLKHIHAYQEHPDMKRSKTARTYMKWDGGRPMPDWMCDNIQKAVDFEDFIRIQCCGKDGVSRGRPFRYAINTYCLKHIDTVEFRFFRATIEHQQILHCIQFCQRFMQSALGDQTPVEAILQERQWNFPKMWYDHESYSGLEATKYGDGRGKKERTLYDI